MRSTAAVLLAFVLVASVASQDREPPKVEMVLQKGFKGIAPNVKVLPGGRYFTISLEGNENRALLYDVNGFLVRDYPDANVFECLNEDELYLSMKTNEEPRVYFLRKVSLDGTTLSETPASKSTDNLSLAHQYYPEIEAGWAAQKVALSSVAPWKGPISSKSPSQQLAEMDPPVVMEKSYYASKNRRYGVYSVNTKAKTPEAPIVPYIILFDAGGNKCFSVANDNESFAVIGDNEDVVFTDKHVYDMRGNILNTYKTDLDVTVFFSKMVPLDNDRELLVVSGDKCRIISRDGDVIKDLSGSAPSIACTAANPRNGTLAVATTTGLFVWNSDGSLRWKNTAFRNCEKVAWSPDGERLAFAFKEYVNWHETNVRILDVAGKELSRFKMDKTDDIVMAWTRDSKSIIVGGSSYAAGSTGHSLSLYTPEGKKLKSYNDAGNKMNYDIALSSDGTYLYVVGDKALIKIDTKKGGSKRIAKVPEVTYAFWFFALAPDDSMIAYIEDDYPSTSIFLYGPDGKVQRKLSGLTSVPRAMAFSPDSKHLAAGTFSGQVGIWNTSGELVKLFQGRDQTVTTLEYSADGRYLYLGGNDGVVTMIRTDDYQSVSLYSDGKDWVCYSDDGYFDASKDGGKLVGATIGRKGYPVDQFALQYNRPDILLARMGSGDTGQIEHYRNQYLKRQRKLGLAETSLASDRHLPEATIVGTAQEGRSIEVGFELADSACDLVSYNVFVNDDPVFGASGKPVSGRKAALREEIVLTKGRNKIEVACANAKGAESYRAATYANYDGAVAGDLYYLGFGVSNYKDPSLNLKYADKDAKDLERKFATMKAGFANVHTATLVNEEVTAESIKAAKSFVAKAKPEDTFVLFIAGHGVHDTDKEATYYFLTYDTDIENLAGTAADFELIEDLLQGIPPRSKLFLMDTCESGEAEEAAEADMAAMAEKRGIQARAARGLAVVQKGMQAAQPRVYLAQKDRYIYNDLLRRSGAIVFSSCRGGEYSYESEAVGNGFFTKKIIEALSGGVKSETGEVSVDALRVYVAEEVAKMSGDLQHPTVDRDNLYQKFGFPASR